MSDEIRPFSNAALQASIDSALESLPEDTKGAVIAHVDGDGASLSIVGKIGDKWSVVAEGYRSWDGELGGAAQVRFTW